MVSALSRLRIKAPDELSDERKREIMEAMYTGTTPSVDAAYKGDPRTRVAEALMQTGRSTAPLQGGITEGIARVLSGGLGGYISQEQRRNATLADNTNQRILREDRTPAILAGAGRTAPGSAGSGFTLPGQQQPPPGAAPPTISPGGGIPGITPGQQPNQQALAAVARNLSPQGGPPPTGMPAGPPIAAPNPNSANVASALTNIGPNPVQGALPGGPAPVMPTNPMLPGPSPVSTPPRVSPATSGASTPTRASQSTGQSAPTTRVLAPGETAGRTSDGRTNTGFNDFRSTAYDPLEDKYAAKYGIPVELLRAVRLQGEQSNADEVSSAGARTVYQFTPDTRRLFRRAYGVDAFAGPEQAVEAAALHLRDDWKRTNGNAAETLAAYHAGPSGNGRGPVNAAYVDRTTSGGGSAQSDTAGNRAPWWNPEARAAQQNSADPGPRTGPGMINASDPEAVPAPQMQSVPALPAPPAPAVRPSLGPPVSSIRMEVAAQLLGRAGQLPDAMLGALMEPEYQAGMAETQAARVQREKDFQTMNQDEWRSNLDLFGNQTRDLSQAQIADHATAIDANDAMRQTQYEGQVTQGRDVTTNRWANENTASVQRQEAWQGRLDREATALTNEQKREQRMLDYTATRTGAEEMQKVQEEAKASADMLGYLDIFQQAQDSAWTGGVQGAWGIGEPIRSGIASWANNAAYGEMDRASQEMSLIVSQKMKGSLSDSDRDWIVRSMPSRGNSAAVNRGAMKVMRNVNERNRDYYTNYQEALANGGAQGRNAFMIDWNQYINNVTLQALGGENYVSFEKWKNRDVRR